MRLSIIRPDDFHVHFRGSVDENNERFKEQNALLEVTSELTSSIFSRALLMPNTLPPIKNIYDYKKYCSLVTSYLNTADFVPYYAIYLSHNTQPEDIIAFKEIEDVLAFKLYPQELPLDIYEMYPLFESIMSIDKALSIHGENVNYLNIDREQEYLPIIKKLSEDFPALRIIFEHVSTKAGVDLINSLSKNVVATITPQHLCCNMDSIIEGNIYLKETIKTQKMNPYNYCIPIPKTDMDRKALIDTATSGNPKYFFGSDNAPHTKAKKLSPNVPAGVFNIHSSLSILAELFEMNNSLNKLEAFISKYGADYYRLNYNNDNIILNDKPKCIPEILSHSNKDIDIEIVPFLSNCKLSWSVEY